jgi:DNA-binding NarL/FixJ family response regulator
MTATRRPVRLLIVDDHPVVRDGVRSMLSTDEVEVVGEAGSGAEALERAAETTPDVVLLDMNLPDIDGLVVLQRLKTAAPQIAVLVFSMHDDATLVRRAVDAGAAGYVLKGASRQELLSSVRAVCEGESVLDSTLLQAILADAAADAARATKSPVSADETNLTPIELEVLRLVASGLTNREISDRLHWSVSTAKKYVQRILKKLHVSDRTQAAVAALRHGVLR